MITYTEAEILNSPYTNYVQIPYDELHNHTFWEIFLILTGQCTHTVNGVSSNLTTGTVCFLRPIKDKHFFEKSQGNTYYRHRDIYVTDSDMQKWCNIISPTLYDELLEPSAPITFSVSASTLRYVEEILNAPNFQSVNFAQAMKTIHFSVSIDLLAAHQLTKIPTSCPTWLNDFVKELKKPENFLYSVEELTAKLPYSHGYICREFKKYLKQTIIDFFNEQKINHASFLLMNTNLKILNISNMVGYSSPKNFINQFTKRFALSPSAWRAKNQFISKK